jgi:bis(5'-nucleosidyl)-tetraphosphatase
MKQHSYGVIIFQDNPRRYLVLLRKRSSDLPKGRAEKGETAEQAAAREAYEETGLRVQLLPGYRHDINFAFLDGKIKKTITFFLAKVENPRVKISDEHKGFKWCTPPEAMELLRYKEQQGLIEKAEEYLKSYS